MSNLLLALGILCAVLEIADALIRHLYQVMTWLARVGPVLRAQKPYDGPVEM
jgi:hypothetical protein